MARNYQRHDQFYVSYKNTVPGHFGSVFPDPDEYSIPLPSTYQTEFRENTFFICDTVTQWQHLQQHKTSNLEEELAR